MQQVNGGYKNRKILKERMELKIQNEKMITKKVLKPLSSTASIHLPLFPNLAHIHSQISSFPKRDSSHLQTEEKEK